MVIEVGLMATIALGFGLGWALGGLLCAIGSAIRKKYRQYKLTKTAKKIYQMVVTNPEIQAAWKELKETFDELKETKETFDELK